jgi:hypothetical protein
MHLYREYPPHPGLAGHVACLWTSHAVPDGAPVRTRVLPDNCIDILWQDRTPLGMVAGMMSRPHHVEAAAPVLTFAMVCRFRRAHAALRRQPDAVDWARQAGDCGYYDQSHLIHAFRQFTDATPESFRFS